MEPVAEAKAWNSPGPARLGRANIGHGQVQYHDLPDSGAEICGFETLHNPETRLGRDIEGVLHADSRSFPHDRGAEGLTIAIRSKLVLVGDLIVY